MCYANYSHLKKPRLALCNVLGLQKKQGKILVVDRDGLSICLTAENVRKY